MSVVAQRTIDLLPASWRFRCYQGDPFDFELHLRVDGQPADVDGWSWAAQVNTGATPLSFECSGLPNGVALYLRGSATMTLPARFCPFDVVGRDPGAGEGRTVLRGAILAATRVTTPVRLPSSTDAYDLSLTHAEHL